MLYSTHFSHGIIYLYYCVNLNIVEFSINCYSNDYSRVEKY